MSTSVNTNQFANWREALAWLFGQDPRYNFTVVNNQNTTFKVRCAYEQGTYIYFTLADQHNLRDMVLLSLEITHPNTLGLNNYWKRDFQYFEESTYEKSPRHGVDGLSYNEKNVSSLFDDLKTGFRGTEKHFFRGETILAIHLCIEAGCLGGIKSLETWQFSWQPIGFMNRLKWLFSSNESRSKYFLAHASPCHVREIDLSTVFKGVSISEG